MFEGRVRKELGRVFGRLRRGCGGLESVGLFGMRRIRVTDRVAVLCGQLPAAGRSSL